MAAVTPLAAESAPARHACAPATRARAGAAAWYALAVLVITTVLGSIDSIMVTLLTEPMRHALALSDTQIGMLKGAGLVLFTGLATLPLGWLSDRYDRRVVLAACILLWSAATALRGTAGGYGMLFVASIGLGVGEAGLGPITNSLIPDLFPLAQRVLANAVFGISALFGSALGALLGGSIVSATEALRHRLPVAMQALETWRLTSFAVGALGLPFILLVLTIRLKRDALKPSSRPALRRAPAPGKEAIRGNVLDISFGDYLRAHWRTLAGLVTGSGLAALGLGSIGSWIPIVAARRFGIAPAQLGQGIGLALLAGTLVGGVLGVVAMRVARRVVGPAAPVRVLTLGYSAAALISIALLFVRSSTDVFVLLAMLLVPLICGAVVLPNILQEVSPPHLRARVISVLTIASLPFSVLGPLAVGMVSDAVKAIPNGLALAIVAITLVGGLLGAALLRTCEPAFVRLLQFVQTPD